MLSHGQGVPDILLQLIEDLHTHRCNNKNRQEALKTLHYNVWHSPRMRAGPSFVSCGHRLDSAVSRTSQTIKQ